MFLLCSWLLCVCGRDLVRHFGRHWNPGRHHQRLCHRSYLRLHPSPRLRLQIRTVCRTGSSRGGVSQTKTFFCTNVCEFLIILLLPCWTKLYLSVCSCMMGYVNASLSVFRVSDFENRSEPKTNGSEMFGEAVQYCRLLINFRVTLDNLYIKGHKMP